MPLYYQLLSPIYYLIPPCIYLYVVMVLNNSKDKPRYYLLHFLPFLLMMADILPWCSLSAAERYALSFHEIKDPIGVIRISTGLFPNWFHYILRLMQGFFYVFYQVRLIKTVDLFDNYLSNHLSYVRIYRCFMLLTVIMALMYMALVTFVVVCIIYDTRKHFLEQTVYLPAGICCISFLLISLYFYFNADLLSGLIPKADTVIILKDETTAETLINLPELTDQFPIKSLYSYAALSEYQKCLEYELVVNQVFKQKGLTVIQLANLCEIPVRALAYLFTNVYFKRFNDFVNEYRLQYIVERMNSTEWRLLTTEGLAMEAGFSSRTTFFLAFKKKYGMNPTEYLKSSSDIQND